MFYTNTNRSFLCNSEIIEWDIKSANISLIKEYNLLDNKTISYIEKLDKKKRVIAVGKIMGKNKEFSKSLERLFNEVVNEFIKVNNLDIDYDIISIKRDAVFVINKEIKVNTFGQHIKFIPKNKYHAYIYIKPYEFYFNEDNSIDVKGINDSIVSMHKDGILSLLSDVIQLSESSTRDKCRLTNYLKEFVVAYKHKELEYDFYREFNNESLFRYQNYGSEMLLETIDEKLLQHINIDYNYIKIILPLIQLIY